MKKILFVLLASFLLAACSAKATAQPDLQATIVALQEQVTALKASATPEPTPAASATTRPSPEQVDCPTEKEFEDLVGVRADVVGTEYCAFHWRGDPATLRVENPCPPGWICTLGVSSKNFVYEGSNDLSPLEIFAGTWRLVSAYAEGDAVHDPCTFLRKVQHEGEISDPAWSAVAGNFSCP